jgi:hypothetical protein
MTGTHTAPTVAATHFPANTSFAPHANNISATLVVHQQIHQQAVVAGGPATLSARHSAPNTRMGSTDGGMVAFHPTATATSSTATSFPAASTTTNPTRVLPPGPFRGDSSVVGAALASQIFPSSPSLERRSLELRVPQDSPAAYAGCKFQLELSRAQAAPSATTGAGTTWMWRSPIYHPMLAKDKRICECVLAHGRARNATNHVAGTLAVIAELLEQPSSWSHCGGCQPDKQILVEAVLDPALFARKAR